MTLTEFVATENSQALDYDGIPADTGQCVQLVAYYCKNILGVDPPALNAVDWWNDYSSTPALVNNFTQIDYTQAYLPQIGDIVVFGASDEINSPLYGHIDICIQNGISSGYLGFDSNWGGDYNAQGYPVAHQVNHTYEDVLGYLRYNGGVMEKVTLSTARIVAFFILGRNGVTNPVNALNGDCDAELNADQVGQDFNENYLAELYASPECHAFLNALGSINTTALNKNSVTAYINKNLS